jgi:hypothetical protein
VTREDVFFNGVDGATGGYLVPPLSLQEVARVAHHEAVERIRVSRAVVYGVDPCDPASAGWGAVFAQDLDPKVESALVPLLEHRKAQVGSGVYRDDLFHLSGESARDFLVRYGAGPGAADHPRRSRVPYYLLLVGGPEEIPFSFQYQLDVQYAVGRLCFATPEDYGAYARSVVEAETGPRISRPRAVLFGVENEDDPATRYACEYLVRPLAERLMPERGEWDLQHLSGSEASKARLGRLLGGAETPDLLFTASHGLGFSVGHPRQLAEQGALLCGDWPGPRAWEKEIPRDFYFAASDVEDGACLPGLVSFHFACHSGGTPRSSPLGPGAPAGSVSVAPQEFVAALPQRLLSRRPQGALATVGHVDRAWGYSFLWDRIGSQPQAFESALRAILAGRPVGYAMEAFNERYADLAFDLLSLMESGRQPDDEQLAEAWMARNDARGYVLFGDPAVRLPV